MRRIRAERPRHHPLLDHSLEPLDDPGRDLAPALDPGQIAAGAAGRA